MKKLSNIKIDQIRFMIPVKDQKLKENEFPIELNKVDNLFIFETIFSQKSIFNFGKNGYTNSINYGASEQGLVTVMFNPKRLDMGLLIDLTASGKAMFESLAQLQDIKVDWKRIVEVIYQKFQGHVSRIDVAIDLIDYGYSVDEIYNKLKNEEYLFLNARKQIIPAKRIRYIGANNQVLTIYVGSRNSDAFLRLYDKRQEQLDNKGLYRSLANNYQDWIRVEGEFKHLEAHAIGAMVSTLNTDNIYPYLADCILKHWNLVINNGRK